MTNEKFEDIWDNIILKLFDEITPQKDVFIASEKTSCISISHIPL